MAIGSIEEALAAYGRGEFLVVIDDEDRENEGDLIIAADAVNDVQMAFMIRHTSGVICAPMPNNRADELDLPLMVVANTESMQTAFTVTIDYRHETTTGISAADRVTTLNALTRAGTRPDDLARPGHIFPLRAREGGVLKRAGHTEAAVDLGRMSGRSEVGVLCEIVNDDGTMARLPDLIPFAEEHGLQLITIADLVEYRLRTENLVERLANTTVPTRHGDLEVSTYRSTLDGDEHVAFVMGDVADTADVLVRVHAECLTGDIFGSLLCNCGNHIDSALETIAAEGRGVIVYLRGQAGREIAHDARTRQPEPADDSREYGIGAQILSDLGITTMRLMTNSPARYIGLHGFGLEVTDKVPLGTEQSDQIRPNPQEISS